MAVTITQLRRCRNFGIFEDRDATSPFEFRRFNLIYGFNGSGKSTFSRALESFRSGERQNNLCENAELEFGTTAGNWTLNDLSQKRDHIAVFNADYVRRNFQWEEGTAEGIAYVGADMGDAAIRLKVIEPKINKAEWKLGFDRDQLEKAEKDFTAFKKNCGKAIKPNLRNSQTYDPRHFARDIEKWQSQPLTALTDDELENKRTLLKQDEAMPKVDPVSFNTGIVGKGYDFVIDLIGKSLGDISLQTLRDNPDFLLWVKTGFDLHTTHELSECQFCGNPLDEKRKAALAQALDDQITKLIEDLNTSIPRLNTRLNNLREIKEQVPGAEKIAPEFRADYITARQAFVAALNEVETLFQAFAVALQKKQANPATTYFEVPDWPEEKVKALETRLFEALAAINDTVDRHNASHDEFAKRQEAAAIAIRQHFVAEFLPEYQSHEQKIAASKAKVEKREGVLKKRRAQRDALEAKTRHWGFAVEHANRLIADYLGHGELSIKAVDKGYQICRYGMPCEGEPSEGEKTAIALAYFMIELDGGVKNGIKEKIVVIDDPVSSLDQNALTYACAMIKRNVSYGEKCAAQVFILTHNHYVFSEFKKGWRGKFKDQTAKSVFFDARQNNEAIRRTKIKKLPELLSKYDSEYQYLFSELKTFAHDEDESHLFLMGNIMRRVMNCFVPSNAPTR